ncbi:cold-shock protein, partial [Nocardia tengchongensis]
MVHGTVKWFDSEKGFGFLTPDVDGPDVFVEYTALSGAGFRSRGAGPRGE